MDTITVFVSQEDIDNGRQCQSTQCPIALALKRQCEALSVVAGLFTTTINSRFYHTPDDAKKWMRQFDHDKNTEPAEFTFTCH